MSTHPRLFTLSAILSATAVLSTADFAAAQFGPRVGFTYQFGISPNVSYNPFAQFLPTVPGRFSYHGYTLSGVGGTVSYGYYRNAAVSAPGYLPGFNGVDEYAPISSGFRSNSKVVAQQRAALAQAQRNAKWDKGATENAPDFDRWLKDAATRREAPTPEKGAKELPIDPALVNPPDEAVLSGEALNRLAVRIRELEKLGKKATPGLLAPELTTKIVFAGGPADAANLYRGTELKYPATLQGVPFEPLRKELDKAFGPVAKDAQAGKKTNPADVDRLLKAITKASDTSRQTVADAAFTEACDVCEFYTTLESATKILKDDKAAGVAGKEWSVVGATVAEVVQHQSKYGLRFGPAKSGEEAAYFSLHRGLLAYCVGLAQAK